MCTPKLKADAISLNTRAYTRHREAVCLVEDITTHPFPPRENIVDFECGNVVKYFKSAPG